MKIIHEQSIDKQPYTIQDIKYKGVDAKVLYSNSQKSFRWAVNWIMKQIITDMEIYPPAKLSEFSDEYIKFNFSRMARLHKAMYPNKVLDRFLHDGEERANICFRDVTQLEKLASHEDFFHDKELVIFYNAEFIKSLSSFEVQICYGTGWCLESKTFRYRPNTLNNIGRK